MRILVTNDDGFSSAFFEILVEIAQRWGTVYPVAPESEQSWSSKSISRMHTLVAKPITVSGVAGFSVSTSPSGCSNIGIFNLLEQKPDLVISGINVGYNAGRGFLLSSGTVGACLEANLACIPAIAFSQALSPANRAEYLKTGVISKSLILETKRVFTEIAEQLVEKLFSQDDFLKIPITWNINSPYQLKNIKLKLARLAESSYQELFKARDEAQNEFVQETKVAKLPEDRDSDLAILALGQPTITPVDISCLGSLDFTTRPKWGDLVQKLIQE